MARYVATSESTSAQPALTGTNKQPTRKQGSEMSKELLKTVKNEAGMATAEYAVATVAATGFAGLLIKLLTGPEVLGLVTSVIEKAFSWLF